ncbi:MAG: hypothetical protein AAFV54_12330, partial [Pseudomonadota bacterium]
QTFSGAPQKTKLRYISCCYDGRLDGFLSRECDEIGELVITLPGQEPIQATIIATRNVSKLGFLGRAAEGLNRLLTSGDGE